MNDLTIQWENISKELKKCIIKGRKKGMMNAVRKIRNKTKSILKNVLPNSTKPNTKYNDKLTDGVRISKYRELPNNESVASVHIMGTRSKGSGTFRLRFFENDTAERHTKGYKRKSKNGLMYHVKGHNTGKIKGKNFFGDAVNSELKNAPSIIEKELIKAIEKCNDK